jgi:hypothetical protein
MAQLSRPFQIALAACVLFGLLWFALLHQPGSGASVASNASSAGAAQASPSHAARHVHHVAIPTTGHRPRASIHTKTSTATRTGVTAASPRAAVTPPRTHSTQGGSAAPAQSNLTPPMQATVAAELGQGKVVLVLFWSAHAADDVAVHGQVLAAAHSLGRSVAVHTATAAQVGSFGSVTRDIQVYQTPTLLIVNPKGQVTTVTGYTDAYAIEQAVREARG